MYGTSVYTSSITVYKRPVANFTSSSAIICGNTPVTFNNTSNGPITNLSWDFGTASYQYYASINNSPTNPIIQFTDSGVYTIRLIASNGLPTCADTITKIDFIKELPPFPKISSRQQYM